MQILFYSLQIGFSTVKVRKNLHTRRLDYVLFIHLKHLAHFWSESIGGFFATFIHRLIALLAPHSKEHITNNYSNMYKDDGTQYLHLADQLFFKNYASLEDYTRLLIAIKDRLDWPYFLELSDLSWP